MIKFFRNIRKKLLSEGKTANYLKYAIGEIVLVVIGILIALAVAEWNKKRHDYKTENRILKELHTAISNDLNTITQELESTNNSMVNLTLLDSLLKLDVPEPSKKLYHLFGAVYGLRILNLNKAIYEDLKSVGFSIIHDEELRSQIIKVYEDDYKSIEGININERSVNQVNRPYYLSNFTSIRFSAYAIPKNIKTIWHDSYYHNIVSYRLVTLEYNQKPVYTKTINDLKSLLKLLERNIN